MDFGELLHTAQRNEQGKKEIKYYSTKFSPPKKEKKSKTLSVNVQKFLARKEAEEKQKQQEAREKRDQLLELRSKDKKATRRVNVMLKRTKSANQSVIEDALDNDNTAVTLAELTQPDEDDYGYVSQEAASFYNKMMEKYSKTPEEPKFPLERKKVSTNLSSTKDRVRAALEKEKEDALLPHRRKRKHADSVDSHKEEEEEVVETVEKREPSKSKFKAPPPMNFMELLKIAEKKQFEPIVIEQKKEEEERPLTKKQKKEFEREREWRERKEFQNKTNQKPPQASNRIPKLNGQASRDDQNKQPKQNEEIDSKRIPKKGELKPRPSSSQTVDKNSYMSKGDKLYGKSDRSPNNIDKKSSQCVSSKFNERGIPPNRDSNKSANNLSGKSILQSKLEKPKVDAKVNISKISPGRIEKLPLKDNHIKRPPASDLKPKQLVHSNDGKSKQFDVKARQSDLVEAKQRKLLPNDLRAKNLPPSDLKLKKFPPSDLKPKQFPPQELTAKQFPPKDLRPKQFPPGDVKRKEFPPRDVRRKLTINRRRILDDDDEYDPEMDDFIDDGPEEGEDYSKYISEIFGYDKNKYRNMDDDVDNMESTFAQQMREEVISTKLGIMEDLEDMRKEEEEKKLKAVLKKRKK